MQAEGQHNFTLLCHVGKARSEDRYADDTRTDCVG